MVQGAQIAAILAADVLADPNFVEPAILLRPTEGFFNDFGEFVPGAAVENIVSLVSAPASGQERLVLPEGVRDMDVRKFWIANDVFALRPGLSDAETIILGSLGPNQNRFNGADKAEAESARDIYAVANPTWLAGYRSNFSLMIQLRGFGMPMYQRYDEIDGHWANADVYRATIVNRWGPFTEVMGVKQDPMRSA